VIHFLLYPIDVIGMKDELQFEDYESTKIELKNQTDTTVSLLFLNLGV